MTSDANKAKITEEASFIEEMLRREEMEEYLQREQESGDVVDNDELIKTTMRNKKGVIIPDIVAKWFLYNSKHHFITLRDDKQLMYYNDGIYIPFGDTYIESEIERITNGEGVGIKLVSEVVMHIKRSTYVNRDVFDTDNNIINMENGLYDISSHKLLPHTPDYLSLHKSPILYDPEAACPIIDKFICDVVPEKNVQTVYEVGGCALQAEKPFKTAFIFDGQKNSGKSVMLKLIEELVGPANTTHVSPLTVSENTFGAAEYFGKQLNIVDDLGITPIGDTGVLKSIIAGGRINAQFKRQQPFDYTPQVLCIFATNELPTTTSFDAAYASRFYIITFPNLFTGDNEDPDLYKKITTPTEMSGFFNKCIGAIETVNERKGFTGDYTLDERVRAYLYKSNPTARFVGEMCTLEDQNDWTFKDDLFHQYVLWSVDENIRVEDMGVLTSYLKSCGCIISQHIDDDGDRKRAYSGIRIKDKDPFE